MTADLEVVSWGVAGSVRDGGRPGLAHLGRARGGAVDPWSLHLGNRLVGNPSETAAIETSGGLVVRCRRALMVAVTGSPCELAVDHGPALGWGTATALPAGAVVRIGRLRGGARVYLCVRGGAGATPGAPGEPVALAVGSEPSNPPSPTAAVPRSLDGPVAVWPGPRLDWFVPGAWEALCSTEWQVLEASDRVGVRLGGDPPLRRAVPGELPSEGLVEGAVQVPPDGCPIVMLADHPTTGGSPVIAVVDPGHLRLVAQRPAGATIRFAPVRRHS